MFSAGLEDTWECFACHCKKSIYLFNIVKSFYFVYQALYDIYTFVVVVVCCKSSLYDNMNIYVYILLYEKTLVIYLIMLKSFFTNEILLSGTAFISYCQL